MVLEENDEHQLKGENDKPQHSEELNITGDLIRKVVSLKIGHVARGHDSPTPINEDYLKKYNVKLFLNICKHLGFKIQFYASNANFASFN